MAYEGFAHVYDELMAHAPYEAWVEFTNAMLKKHRIPTNSVLDLGCGTGEISLRLARAGYDVTGVDASSDMLSVATEKALAQRTPVTWIQQDITKLTGFTKIDVCVSYCDVINYILSEKAVKAVFHHVFASLTEGGLFMFDLHDPLYAENDLIGHTFAEVTDDVTYIWECEQNDEAIMHHYLTFFQRQAEDYVRFDELHEQKLYERDFIKELLISCGFTKIEFYLDFNAEKVVSTETGERIFVLAQK